MARELVPLLVVIGLEPNGKGGMQHDHPNFNELAVVKASGLDWSHYIDVYGTGWLYDHSCGHSDERIAPPEGVKFNSDHGQWLGVLMVPAAFATQAELAFPDLVEPLTEAELETYYDNFHNVRIPEEKTDDKVLTIIAARQSAKLELTATELKALDPADPTPGIVTNEVKKFAGFKTKKNITVISHVK